MIITLKDTSAEEFGTWLSGTAGIYGYYIPECIPEENNLDHDQSGFVTNPLGGQKSQFYSDWILDELTDWDNQDEMAREKRFFLPIIKINPMTLSIDADGEWDLGYPFLDGNRIVSPSYDEYGELIKPPEKTSYLIDRYDQDSLIWFILEKSQNDLLIRPITNLEANLDAFELILVEIESAWPETKPTIDSILTDEIDLKSTIDQLSILDICGEIEKVNGLPGKRGPKTDYKEWLRPVIGWNKIKHNGEMKLEDYLEKYFGSNPETGELMVSRGKYYYHDKEIKRMFPDLFKA